MCRHSAAMGGGTRDCVGGTPSFGKESIQPQSRIERSLSLSRFDRNAPESALSEMFVFDQALIRLAGVTPVRKAEVVALAVREHLKELPRSFAVIMPGIFRISSCQRVDFYGTVAPNMRFQPTASLTALARGG